MVSDAKIPPAEAESFTTASGRLKPQVDPVGDSFADASRHLSDAIAFGRAYLMAQADRLKVLVRNLFLMAALGIVAALIAATILVCSTVLLCNGVADGIAALLGGRQWAGDLITGGIVVGTVLLSARFVVRGIMNAARERTRREYEQKPSRN
jgi:hypothetical protein